MKSACKHCGLPVPYHDPYAGFCCTGCREVYSLIHDSGHEDYYERQDRVGRAISGREVSGKSVSTKEFWSAAREYNGRFDTTLYVSGMTCRGCSWLVQRVASREPHILSAAVSLVSGRMELRHEKDFDFQVFQERLSHFAYGLSTSAGLGGLSLSPILVRAILTGVFALNGSLLAFATIGQIGGDSLVGILPLLSLVNLLLLMFVGGGVFLKTALAGLRFRQLHSDFLPALVLGILGVLSLFEIFSLLPSVRFSIVLFVLLPVLIIARVLGDLFESWVRRKHESEGFE